MLTRFFKFNALLLLLMGIAFTACEKEEIITSEDPILTEDFTVTERGIVLGPRGDRVQCYQILFPVYVTFPDREDPVEATDAETLRQMLRDWKANNPGAEDRPRITFPYEVELRDGTIATVETLEDVKELRQDCRLDRPHRPTKCWRLVYPVTVNLPNGNTAEAQNGEELHQIYKTWKEENPNSEEKPELAFPYQVELRNGALITIESGLDIRQLPRGCKDRPKPPCYQLIYPVTLVFPGADGITVEVENLYAMHRVMKEWRENYPNAEGRPEVLFPYDVRLRDGTLSTIENEEDLAELRESCGDARPFRPKCFRVTFPLTLKYPDGREVVVNDRVEYHVRLWKWNREHPFSPRKPRVAFPFTVKFRNGETAVVNNAEELAALRERCAG